MGRYWFLLNPRTDDGRGMEGSLSRHVGVAQVRARVVDLAPVLVVEVEGEHAVGQF